MLRGFFRAHQVFTDFFRSGSADIVSGRQFADFVASRDIQFLHQFIDDVLHALAVFILRRNKRLFRRLGSPVDNPMAAYLSICLEDIAVNLIIFVIANENSVAGCSSFQQGDFPDSALRLPVAYTDNGAVIKSNDNVRTITPDFVFLIF